MKWIYLAALFLICQANAEQIHGENGWHVPQHDGTFVWMDKATYEQEVALNARMQSRFSLNPVNFYLYTKSNPLEPQEIFPKLSSIKESNFNAKLPTRFTIHGWTADYSDIMNSNIREAWWTHGDMNIIAVDWGRARSYEYISSVMAVPGVGEKVADLINFLQRSYQLSLDDIILIGHSLGAHVAGHAGKNVKMGKVRTIIGLDPALPLFDYEKPNERLNDGDAHYVETIQTNGGFLGFLKPIGQGVFYPNGGASQPGCGIDLTGSCAHTRSHVYYAEAVRLKNFPSIKCNDFEAAVAAKCGSSYSKIFMGDITNAYTVNGHFYVPVKKKTPHGMGSS